MSSSIISHYDKQDLPPLVSKRTKKRIRIGVTTFYLLLFGIPLAWQAVSSWFDAKEPEQLIIIDIDSNVLEPNELPYDPEPPVELPDMPNVPTPPEITPPAPTPPEPVPTPPSRDMSQLPLQPSVVDNSWQEPTPDKVEPPKPPAPDKPKPDKPKPDKPKPDKPKPATPPRTDNPNLRQITGAEASNITNRGRTQNTNPDARHDPNKPIGGRSTPDAKFYRALKDYVEIKWKNGHCPSQNQLAGRTGAVILELDIAQNGKLRSAVIKTPSRIAAIDNAAKALCAELLRNTMPKPLQDVLVTIQLEVE